MYAKAECLVHFSYTFSEKKMMQGSKKNPSGHLGQVDFPFGQVTFSPYLPHGQGPRQAVCRLNF